MSSSEDCPVDEAGACSTLPGHERVSEMRTTEGMGPHEESGTEQAAAGEIVGDSEAIRKVLHRIEIVAPTDSSVLISGETGTGKELVARAIHRLSHRADKPLIKVNCGALPIGLIESELFGHEKGAFTGAFSSRVGRFELADRGTIFLDEIGDLPQEAQAKLLRVLQYREFERVGGSRTLHSDVRVIAATHRDLAKSVELNQFREDLYYRLNVFQIVVPSLRDRTEDIPLLAHHFLAKHARIMQKPVRMISSKTMTTLMNHVWPGNVRELESAIERGVIFSQGTRLELSGELIAPPRFADPRADGLSGDGQTGDAGGDEFERLLEVLKQVGGNRSKAARILGIGRTTLWRRLKASRPSGPVGNS